MFCHKCGAQIAEGAIFCHKCGTQVVYADTEPHRAVSEQKIMESKTFSKKTYKIIASALAVTILLVLILSGALQNAFDKLIDINREIESQATGSTTVPGIQSAADIFPSYNTGEVSANSSESSFAWVEDAQMVTEGDIFKSRYIVGSIQNLSDVTFPYASVEFVLYDSSGNQIGSASDYINDFIAGNVWRFKVPVWSDDAAYFEFLHATKRYPK